MITRRMRKLEKERIAKGKAKRIENGGDLLDHTIKVKKIVPTITEVSYMGVEYGKLEK